MAFQLRVSTGAAAGEEYSFTDEARLGRTADNDVVVKDGAASRSHARVFQKAGKYYVEDLGSANGTRLNNAPVKAPRELKSGDAIMIGDTVFEVELALDETMAPAPSGTMDESADDPAEDPNMTRPPTKNPPPRRSTAAMPAERRSNPAAARPDATNADEDAAGSTGDEGGSTGDDGGSTGDDGGSTGDDGAEQPEDDDATGFVDVPKPKALTTRGSGARPAPAPPARPSRGGGLERPPRRSLAREEPAGGEVELSAAERARLRRQLQQSAGGRVQLMWQDLPKGARALLAVFGTILLVGTVALAGYVAWPRQRINRVEPKSFPLDGALIEDSFGEGRVTFRTPDQKAFTFNATSPTRIVGVLHYQAANISTDEVTVNLNGQDLGTVPPDNIDVESREIELILPAAVLKPRDENLIIFDNVKNPPGEDEWKIWNLWVEIIPVPEMSADEARRRAGAEIERASKAWEMREVGAANLFRAWKTYREAWLLLEATPDAPAELLTLSRTRMKEIRPELDRKCNSMIIKFQSIVNTRPDAFAEGRQVLENIPEHFPTREHPCYNFSRALLRKLDGFEDFEAAGAPPVE
ncbi:MAG: FHA domain-containing protein [Myxococcaceae bacterium]|nr:FHA domain-containing protein [Myxococcaceae bacterium]